HTSATSAHPAADQYVRRRSQSADGLDAEAAADAVVAVIFELWIPDGQASDRRSRHAPAPVRIAAYPHNSAKPVHGDSAFGTKAAPPQMTSPAFEGRYWARWLLIEAGSSVASSGITKNTAAKVAIPAAVLRSSAPRPTPIRPATVTYRAAPMTDLRAS